MNAFQLGGPYEVWFKVCVAPSKRDGIEWITEIGPTEVDAVAPWRGTVAPK